MINRNKQNGAVSLFVVMFAALLISVVTVSFIRIMIQSQQQASSVDLSQSAFDSAQAGVEDAKRALIRFQNYCETGGDCSISYSEYLKLNSQTCNDAVRTLNDVQTISPSGSGKEVKVLTKGAANNLEQAYTCVKINTQTEDYTGVLAQDTSKFIPLVGASIFDRIKIEWFSEINFGDVSSAIEIPQFSAATPLLSQSTWTANRPSIIRAQLIQFNTGGFSLTDFEDNSNANGSNNTLFLYPSNIVETTKSFTTNNTRQPGHSGGPILTRCDSAASLNYFCSATITLPKVVTNNNHSQYLNLTSLYKASNYRVTLYSGSVSPATAVKFDNVQPSIDSTGRANDIYRRVRSRVELTNINFPYPAAEVDITGNLCKDFQVTDDVNDFNNNCTP